MRTRVAMLGALLLAVFTLTGVMSAAAFTSPHPPWHWVPCGFRSHHCHTKTPTPTPTPSTTSPSPSPTPTTTSPSPTPTVTPPVCTSALNGGACGPYTFAGIPMSNGFDTYVEPQNVGANAGDTAVATVADPGSWSVAADVGPAGAENVQVFANVQQLTNDWCGNGWDAHGHVCSGADGDTPLDSLSSLTISFAETSPGGGVWEFAPDIWSANYPSDVMFWTDTMNRCNTGAFGGTVLGHMTMDGQGWTVHRYGGAGAEIIFVLDGAGGQGTCAQETSGTVDVKAGFDWLTSNGFVTGPEVVTQMNTGWEICSTAGTTEPFAVTSYSIGAVAG